MSKILTWRAPDNDVIFLEVHKLNWSNLCREMLDKKKVEINNEVKVEKRNTLRTMSNDLMLFFFGVMCLGLSYVVINYLVFIMLNIAALFCMSIGLILLIREAIYARTSRG